LPDSSGPSFSCIRYSSCEDIYDISPMYSRRKIKEKVSEISSKSGGVLSTMV
jgi:hypothetical protein